MSESLDTNPIVVSAVLLRNEAGDILTVRKRGTSKFMFVGGKHEPDESPAEAAIRETYEEVSVRMNPERLISWGRMLTPAANEDGRMLLSDVFFYPVPVEPVVAGEIDELRWVAPRGPFADDLAPLAVRVLEAMDQGADADGVRSAYDTVAATYAEHLRDTSVEHELDLAMIDTFAGLAREVGAAGGRVLDAGCGAGRITRYLAERGANIEGLDLSGGMLERARAASPELTFTQGSLLDLPYPTGHFAGVMLWYSTIHTPVELQPRIFAEAARATAKGGHVMVAFQVGEGTRDLAAAYATHGHKVSLERYRFGVDQVAGWLSEAGLTLTHQLVRSAQSAERDDQAVLIARH